MAKELPQDNVSKIKTDEAKSALGINRAIYAAGYSAKDGFFWGLGTFAAILTTLVVGKKFKSKHIEQFGKWLDSASKEVHTLWEWIPVLGPFITKCRNHMRGAEVALALSVSFIVSHIAMGPGSIFGWKKANEAIDKYAILSDEKEQLIKANVILAEDNDKLRAQLERPGNKSFTERLASQQASAESQLRA